MNLANTKELAIGIEMEIHFGNIFDTFALEDNEMNWNGKPGFALVQQISPRKIMNRLIIVFS